MEPILDYYNINIIDIWPYERGLFFNEKSTEERILLIEKKTIKLIIENSNLQENTSKVKPFTDLSRYDSGEHEGYWMQHLYQWDRAFNNVQERIALNYFLHQDGFYSFIQNIEIDLTNEDFDFWFSLKLAQYNENVKCLSRFLDFQLTSTFDDDIAKISGFLNLLLCQHEHEMLPTKVVKSIKDWLNETTDGNFNNEAKNELKVEIHKTYYLDIVRDQPSILLSNNEFLEALGLLKKKKLINQDTNLEQFRQIFQSKGLEENNFIQWTGSLIELKWLIQEICAVGVCSHIKGIEKWQVAQHCFVIKDKGQWVKINKYTKISNANGSDKNKPTIFDFGKKLKSL
jgi:hypothetical protein